MNFANEIIEIHVLLAPAHEVPPSACQGECPNGLPIVATKLPKLQGTERENMNCGNQVAENGRKKKVIVVAKILGRN